MESRKLVVHAENIRLNIETGRRGNTKQLKILSATKPIPMIKDNITNRRENQTYLRENGSKNINNDF